MSGNAQRRAFMGALVAGGSAVIATLVSRGVAAQTPREIEIVARRFNFTPSEIALKVGEPVALLIRSIDFVHGFNIPDLGRRVDLLPGRVTRLEITPLKTGKLEFVCDNFCGDSHEEMHGQFMVTA
jgi:cytochrome c oxidase subunit II